METMLLNTQDNTFAPEEAAVHSELSYREIVENLNKDLEQVLPQAIVNIRNLADLYSDNVPLQQLVLWAQSAKAIQSKIADPAYNNFFRMTRSEATGIVVDAFSPFCDIDMYSTREVRKALECVNYALVRLQNVSGLVESY